MPGAFTTADESAIRAEKWSLALHVVQLVLLVAAAIVGAIGLVVEDQRLVGLLIVACLVVVTVCRLAQRVKGHEHLWYNGRAAAESVKTLAWRYAMKVLPFDDDRTAADLFEARVTEVTLAADLPPGGTEVTPEMEQLRRSALDERSRRYLEDRIDDQCRWYTAKSERFRRLAQLCDRAFFVLTMAAIGTALFVAFGRSDVALIAILETAVAAVIGWAGVRAYGPVATAYAFTARELQAIRDLGDRAAPDDHSWAEFVGDAEDAISREHTMWRASRASASTAPAQ